MFNDEFGLTKAVLDGRKTMTRRAISNRLEKAYENSLRGFPMPASVLIQEESRRDYFLKHAPNKVGDILAVGQSYKDAGYLPDTWVGNKQMKDMAGWTNKMYVQPQSMRHYIRITSVKVERLQDIIRDDILREGVGYENSVYFINDFEGFTTAHHAFKELINRISGLGTWEMNPMVFVYSFELVR